MDPRDAKALSELRDLINRASDLHDRFVESLSSISRPASDSGSLAETPPGVGARMRPLEIIAEQGKSKNQLFSDITCRMWDQIILADNRANQDVPEPASNPAQDYFYVEDTDPAIGEDSYESAIFEGIEACIDLKEICLDNFVAAAVVARAYDLDEDQKSQAIRRALDRADPDLVSLVNDLVDGMTQVSVPDYDDAPA